MSAVIVFLPTPDVGEAHTAFRARFETWRQASQREPQPPPRHFPLAALGPDPIHDPAQMALPLLLASPPDNTDKRGRRA